MGNSDLEVFYFHGADVAGLEYISRDGFPFPPRGGGLHVFRGVTFLDRHMLYTERVRRDQELFYFQFPDTPVGVYGPLGLVFYDADQADFLFHEVLGTLFDPVNAQIQSPTDAPGRYPGTTGPPRKTGPPGKQDISAR